MGSLQAFSAQRVADDDEARLTEEAVIYLETKAPRSWVAGRVVTLLSHYFVAQTDASVAEAVAEDWCAMLEDYPAWAIANAARWWMSRENPRKHCKPLPGDIQERAHEELAPVRAAWIMARRGPEAPVRSIPISRGPIDYDARRADAERILREVGMAHTMPRET